MPKTFDDIDNEIMETHNRATHTIGQYLLAHKTDATINEAERKIAKEYMLNILMKFPHEMMSIAQTIAVAKEMQTNQYLIATCKDIIEKKKISLTI